MYAVSRGDPRPRRGDFVSAEDYARAFRAWCRIHAYGQRLILREPRVQTITFEELMRRLRGES